MSRGSYAEMMKKSSGSVVGESPEAAKENATFEI